MAENKSAAIDAALRRQPLPRRQAGSSQAAEDSQIDLLTLASALMLTVLCLLLSQVLSEKSSGHVAPLDESIPEVHRLRVSLVLPMLDKSSASLDETGRHPALPNRISVETPSGITPVKFGEAIEVDEIDVKRRLLLTQIGTYDKPTRLRCRLDIDIELNAIGDDAYANETRLIFSPAANPSEIPTQAEQVWQAMSDIGEESPESFHLPISSEPSNHEFLTLQNVNQLGLDSRSAFRSFYIGASESVDRSNFALCRPLSPDPLLERVFTRLNHATADFKLIDTQFRGVAIDFKPKFSAVTSPRGYGFRIRVHSPPPTEDAEGVQIRTWSAWAIPHTAP